MSPRGGVPKLPVTQALVTEQGVSGDRQRDRRYHGGPDRAVCLYSFDLIQSLQSEGHPIAPGTIGENLTLRGVDWATLRVGDGLLIGELLRLQITGYAAPCRKIGASFANGEFIRISHRLRPGWSRLYARVLQPGTVFPGDVVTLDDQAAAHAVAPDRLGLDL